MQIRSKLIIALMCLGLLLCAVLYLFMQWSFDRGMIHYVNEKEKELWQSAAVGLANHYQKEGNWQAFVGDKRRYGDFLRTFLDASRGHDDRPERGPPHLKSKKHGSGKHPPPRHRRAMPALLDTNMQTLVGTSRDEGLLMAISVDGEVKGWLALPKPKYPIDHANLSIKNNLDMAFALVSLALVFCVLFVGLPLSRHLVQPLRQFANAADALTKGNYAIKFDFKRKDEIGSLARDFEALALTLKSNEASRSRWVADISHELRTPISILLGEIDAMLERIRPINDENLESLKQEVDQLNHLVNDLYELSNAEIGALRYNKVPIDLRSVFENAVQRFEELFKGRGFKLEMSLDVASFVMVADIQRLNQLLNNLFSNELKYASEGATLKVAMSRTKHEIVCTIEDSGPGVADEHLGKLFDHIYRVECSRNRKTGGSGLGLAICRKIVEAHQGEISASNSPLGGLMITIRFPIV